MKKKIIVFLIIILIIVGVVFARNKINDSKINYELTKVSEFNYVQYYENGKYGILDKEGNVVIQAEYKNIVIPNPEKDVFITYGDGDNTKVLNSKGEEIFTKFSKVEAIKLKNIASVLCYEKSVLKYEEDGKYGIIDFDGKKITKNEYDSIENLQSVEGKLLVSKDNKYGVININGTELVETKYDNIKTDGYYNKDDKYVKAGFIVSNTSDDGYKFGYIDYKGKEIIDTKYSDVIRIGNLEKEYLVVSENGKYGLFNRKKQVIPHEYQSIVYDESGLVILDKNKKLGMADLKGNIVIGVEYTELEYKGIYIYASKENENIVYDKQGNKIDTNFNKAIYEIENENYRISTILNNDITYYGIVNKEGTSLVSETYGYIEYAYGDYFVAKDDQGNFGVINANGKTLVDFKYGLAQRVKDKNIIQLINKKYDRCYIYSSTLEKVCEMKNAIIRNEDNFIKVYNEKEARYFDNNGKELSENDDIVKEDNSKELPSKIGDYEKVQYALDSVYYVKK
ncbi:MAG: hypothetical protein HFJ17_03020 [Clostridia bacterium]|nr:hypothetical protein [Clostridia bacterium]